MPSNALIGGSNVGLLVIQVVISNFGATITPPDAGWIAMGSSPYPNTSSTAAYFYRFLDDTEGTSVTFTLSMSSTFSYSWCQWDNVASFVVPTLSYNSGADGAPTSPTRSLQNPHGGAAVFMGYDEGSDSITGPPATSYTMSAYNYGATCTRSAVAIRPRTNIAPGTWAPGAWTTSGTNTEWHAVTIDFKGNWESAFVNGAWGGVEMMDAFSGAASSGTATGTCEFPSDTKSILVMAHLRDYDESSTSAPTFTMGGEELTMYYYPDWPAFGSGKVYAFMANKAAVQSMTDFDWTLGVTAEPTTTYYIHAYSLYGSGGEGLTIVEHDVDLSGTSLDTSITDSSYVDDALLVNLANCLTTLSRDTSGNNTGISFTTDFGFDIMGEVRSVDAVPNTFAYTATATTSSMLTLVLQTEIIIPPGVYVYRLHDIQ